MSASLYIISTPIGNLADISQRAKETLENVDLIACEDTRMTGKLLSLLGLTKKPLIAYHDHNADKMRPELIARMEKGEKIALVTDAGTPLVSDPGYKLVRDCHTENIVLTAIPGACSVINALVLAGLPTDKFHFLGFLPNKKTARQKELNESLSYPGSLIFFDSPKRLAASLNDMADIFGPDRQVAVLREMTKMYEEIRQDRLENLCHHYAEQETPKGEIVLVVAPDNTKNAPLTEAEIDKKLQYLLTDLSTKEAAKRLAEETGLAKRDLYQKALALKDKA